MKYNYVVNSLVTIGSSDFTIEEEINAPANFKIQQHLEYFGNNTLKVYDRWGQVVYNKENHTNDWTPNNVSDGTYYYVLTAENGDTYPGFYR